MISINRNRPKWCEAPSGALVAQDCLPSLEAVERHGQRPRMIEGLASEDGEDKGFMIDATSLKGHRTASNLRAKQAA